MKTPITILIADDHPLFADGLTKLLNDESDMEVWNIVSNGRALIDMVRDNQPNLILLDINMPLLNGLDAVKNIKHDYPKIKILMLSTYGEEHLIEKAKSYGANGYLLKNANKEELLQTIRLIAAGQSSFPYRINTSQNNFDEADNFLKKFNLTKRELQIIELIKKGLTNTQIASTIQLSIYTVETHRKNIMHKLKLNSPAALIKFIIENNL
ncbi:response regulator transcription factor [Panacibacter ginsenosidivorans]|uniref:Response regulator transcription factor n=1 Tax=Panacibacter ginsenosidivorans TaxID=1813871 RepID=A0A5B8VEX4_9BACT|nr:response regulator transcription factor [Panacibacter ginsenosidivorans]QEC69990.1 response regulator transcription factor [Panacibacter ginsenosidivorans]